MARHQQGKIKAYVSMLTIVVLMIIVTTVTITVITVLIDNTYSYKITSESDKARANADACVEVAINKLKESTAYAGNETITTQHGTCTIGALAGSGNTNRTIQSTGLYNNITRKAKVIVGTVNPTTIITTWTEVDAF